MSCPLGIHFTARPPPSPAICRVPTDSEAKKAEGFSNCDMTKKLIFPCSLRYSACRLRQKPFSCAVRMDAEAHRTATSVWKKGCHGNRTKTAKSPKPAEYTKPAPHKFMCAFWRTSR